MIRAVIASKRLYFRPLEESDIDIGWHDWINDFRISRQLDGVFPVNRKDLADYWSSIRDSNAIMFAVCDIENDSYFGNVRLGEIDWQNRKCSYGRMIGDENYRGKGYGTEALILLLQYAFLTLGLNRVYTGVASTNLISISSNEKAGMLIEGTEKQAIWKDGEFVDVVQFAMTRSEFDRLHQGELLS